MDDDFGRLEDVLKEEDAKSFSEKNEADDIMKGIENEGLENNPAAEPVVETAAEPQKEPAAEPVVETQKFDWSQFGEGFTDEKSVKEFIESSKPKVSEYEKLAAKVKELESANPFSDEMLYKLDQIKKNSPDKFDIARNLAFGKPDPLDILKMQLENENEAFKKADDSDKLAYLRRQYKLSHNLKEPSEDDYSEEEYQERMDKFREAEEEVRVGRMRLSIDAENAQKKLYDSMFGAIEVPKRESTEDLERKTGEAVEALKGSWDSVMSKISFKDLSVKMFNPEDKSTNDFIKLDVPADEVVKYKNELRDIMVNAGSPTERVTEKDIAGYIEKRYREDHFAEVVWQVVKKASAMGEDGIRKEFYNPQKPIAPTDPAAKGLVDKKTTEAEVDRALNDF
jgi:hypothetical protein